MKEKNQRIILPVSTPPITAWQWQANPLAVLWGKENTKDWIFCNYILLKSNIDDWSKGEKLYLDFIPHPFFSNCPWLKYRILDRESMKKWGGIQDFLIDCLKNDYYIFTLADQSFFLNINHKRLHETFIYGIDGNKGVGFIADFINGKYSFKQVDLKMLCKGIEKVSNHEDYWDDRGGIYLIKYIENIGYSYHPKSIKQSIYSYLHPEHLYSYIDSQTTRFIDNPIHYGIDVYNQLIDHILFVSHYHHIPDKRTFHNFLDHKHLMVLRVNWLLEEKHIKIPKDILIGLKKLEDQADLLCNWAIKLNLLNKVDCAEISNKMINILMRMKENEYLLYEHLNSFICL